MLSIHIQLTQTSHFMCIFLEGDDQYVREAHCSRTHNQNTDAAVGTR